MDSGTIIKRLALIYFLFFSIVNSAGAFTMVGDVECGTWVKDRLNPESIEAYVHNFWIMGFISGLASAKNVDILLDANNDSIFLYVDNYCKTNPLSDLGEAGSSLFFALKRKKGL